MKPTGPTKLSTKLLSNELRKKSSKSKKTIWKTISNTINSSRRSRIIVNLSKIEKMTKKNKGKILIVPGKVLGFGTLTEKTTVAALEFSEKAKKQINEKGKTLNLKELIEGKEKESNLIIIK